MNIGVVSREYPWRQPFGGVGTYSATLARALAGDGHRVTVVTQSPSAEAVDEELDGVRVVGLPLRPPVLLPRFSVVEGARWSRLVARIFKRLGPASFDIVEAPEMAGEALGLLGWRRRPPVVIKIHSGCTHNLKLRGAYRWYHYPMYWRERQSLRRTPHVTAVSEVARRRNARTFELDLSHVQVLHNPIDTERFKPGAGRSGDAPTVLFVGHLNRIKGFDRVPAIIGQILDQWPAVSFEIAGSDQPLGQGSDELATEFCRRRLRPEHQHRVRFRGVVPYERMPDLYQRCDIVLAPSRAEAFPGVCLEAGASGLPVVGTAGTGMDAIVADGETGSLVDSPEPAAYARKLSRLIADSARAQEMGRAARRRIVDRWGMRVVARQTRSFYRTVIEHGSK